MSRILALIVSLALIFGTTAEAKAAELTQRQLDNIEEVGMLAVEEFDTYGAWPSTMLAFYHNESSFGVGPNDFGIKGESGKSTTASVYGFYRLMYNQYFRGEGAFAPNAEEQIAIMMEGGRYCAGEYPYGPYYYRAINAISDYDLDRFDEMVREKIREKERKEKRRKAKKLRKERQKLPFEVVLSRDVLPGTCVCDPTYVKKGSVVIFGYNILECTETQKGLGNTILVQDPTLGLPLIFDDGLEMWEDSEVYLTEVIENAKG